MSGADGPVEPAPLTASRWQLLPDELLLLIFDFLGFDDRVSCADVCANWHRIFLSDSFSGALYLEASNVKRHAYLVRRHGPSARRVALFDLKELPLTLRILNWGANFCDGRVLKSLTLSGDEKVGAFHDQDWWTAGGVGWSPAVEPLFLPSLGLFFQKIFHEDEDDVAALIERTEDNLLKNDYDDDQEEKEVRNGFELEHLSMINLRFTIGSNSWPQAEKTLWNSLYRNSATSLKSLDLVYFTGCMYWPSRVLTFQALEQVCVSTNHLHAQSLDTLAKHLPQLNHLIVYCVQRSLHHSDSFSLDEDSWLAFHAARPTLRLSFILRSARDARDNVPRNVPIYGLEVLKMEHSDSTAHLKETLQMTENLAILRCGPEELLLDLLDESLQLMENDTRNSNNNHPSNGPSSNHINQRQLCKLHRLRKFQYGGKHSAAFYFSLAERVAKIPNLVKWIVAANNASLSGPHSTMAHGTCGLYDKKRRDIIMCKAPPDHKFPLLCSASSFAGFYRQITSHVPREKLKILTNNSFLSTSLFWKTDPQVLFRMRKTNC